MTTPRKTIPRSCHASTAGGLALILACFAPVVSGEQLIIDFNDPVQNAMLNLIGNAQIRSTDGANQGVGGNDGYASITDALNGQRGAIIVNDPTNGEPITRFKLSVDIRSGGGTVLPADGISFNLVRPSDPLLAVPLGEGYAGFLNDDGLDSEEGSQTGIGIGIDDYDSGGSDVIGISVRVEGALVQQIAVPTLHGQINDPTSLQTGPDAAQLGWARFEAVLNRGNLTLTWKNSEIFHGPINWVPGPAQIVIGSRTGGANANHHIDNLSLEFNAISITLPVDPIADSEADWLGNAVIPAPGTPDANGWNYGYWNLTNDANGIYAPDEFQQFTDLRGDGFGLAPSAAPWTNISTNIAGHPNGTNSLPNEEHWVIRRYTVFEPAELVINWFLRAQNSGGSGTTMNIYHNGLPMLTTTQDSTSGASGTTSSIRVAPGDMIDFALTPEGTDGDRIDGADDSHFGGSLTPFQPAQHTLGVIADSVNDFEGTQGSNGWDYGYYDITGLGGVPASADDFIPFPDGGGPHSDTNFWTGESWDWFGGDPPWTKISASSGHPSGTNQLNEHLATRRYTVQSGEEGNLLLQWNLSSDNPIGSGTSVHIFVNGVEVDFGSIAGNDAIGIRRSVFIPAAEVGDIIDIALSAVGITGDTTDVSDDSSFGARIHQLAPPDHAFAITDFDIVSQTPFVRTWRLIWNSNFGEDYQVFYSQDLLMWFPASTELTPSAGFRTEIELGVPLNFDSIYFRVE